MKISNSLCQPHRSAGAVTSCAVRRNLHFRSDLRDIKELLFDRGVMVSNEKFWRWHDKFGAHFMQQVK
jgi:transposase-like protein